MRYFAIATIALLVVAACAEERRAASTAAASRILRASKQPETNEVNDNARVEKQAAPATDDNVVPTEFAELGAQWRFGSNYVPQHYGNWQFHSGTWNFGNDKRIECEACGYVMYMLIDRLGDEFNHKTVVDEMNALCPRVQWVFRSGCQHIFNKHSSQIISMVMRLTEPEDICKQLTFCSPDFYDVAMMGGAGGMYHPGMNGPFSHMNALNPHGHFGGGMSMNYPSLGYSHSRGSGYGMYPPPGQRPMAANSPYSPYSFGGYDGFGFPMPHPGVPSSTPPPPDSPTAGAGAAAAGA